MKWLIDAQFPPRLSLRLREAGHDSVHTTDLPEGNRTPDATLNELSLTEQRVLITKDADFLDSYYLQRKPFKLFLISTGNLSNSALEALVMPALATIASAFETANFIELTQDAWVIHE